ncbi:MAG: hypothetical protein PHT79_12375 [Syntrophomonadaceae bacterium]|nr:hypothetical protein [Syntrophomonadaceae bacterium]MDD4550540.1 hypothetical protein [Syntrophomonadaceae bacterium]
MTIALIIIAYAIICLIEVPSLVKKGYWRELFIFIAFLLPALTLSLLQGAEVDLPQIVPAINTLMGELFPNLIPK